MYMHYNASIMHNATINYIRSTSLIKHLAYNLIMVLIGHLEYFEMHAQNQIYKYNYI